MKRHQSLFRKPPWVGSPLVDRKTARLGFEPGTLGDRLNRSTNLLGFFIIIIIIIIIILFIKTTFARPNGPRKGKKNWKLDGFRWYDFQSFFKALVFCLLLPFFQKTFANF